MLVEEVEQRVLFLGVAFDESQLLLNVLTRAKFGGTYKAAEEATTEEERRNF